MTTRLVSALAVMMLLLAGAVSAQPVDFPELYERLALSDRQIEQIEEINSREERVIREARAELNVYKAELERLLIEPDVDMGEVERILKDSMQWKLQSELAEIRRRVALRRVMGEDTWERFLRLMQAARRRNEQRPPAPR